MEDNRSPEPSDYRPGLNKVRKRRWFLWLVILLYLPAMMVALNSTNYKTWVIIVFSAWIVLLICAVAFACVVRCPRCGQYFHTHGPTFLPFRRCLHCALHVNADSRAPETTVDQPSSGKKN